MPTQTADESSTTSTTELNTLNRLFLDRAARTPDRVALRRKIDGNWEDISWRGYYEAATKVGRALRKAGLEDKQPVAILSETRAEWAFCDLGILCAGGITVPIYHSNLPDEVKYILDDSEAAYMLVENVDQWKKLHGILDQLDAIKLFVIFETGDTESTKAADYPFPEGERVVTLDAFLEAGEGEDLEAFEEIARGVEPDDVVTYIYTSGTTGPPKGVVLTQACAVAEAEALGDAVTLSEQDITLAFLPLAHVFARALHWTQLRCGYITAFAESIPKVMENMGEIQPTFFAAVPRIYEKIHAAVLGKIKANTGFKLTYAEFALAAAMQRAEVSDAGELPGLGLALKCAVGGPVIGKVADGLQSKTGGKIRFFISGGAPLSREIAVFFKALGLSIFEGYGLTETTAATHINRPGAWRLGSVGKVVKGVEQKIAPDGEILVRGPVVMREYYKRADATAESIQDGWFHTGDIGVIDADGFLKITDRKKDILVTAAGKNISPQNVENHVKTHPLISQVALFGDKRKFCVALITVDEEAARNTLERAGVTVPSSLEDLIKVPELCAMIQKGLDEKNSTLPQYETIKYYQLLPKDFEVGEELTPTLKVKRKVVLAKYEAIIEKLFSDNGA
jgi:long-chain acyl-CoA synthetase